MDDYAASYLSSLDGLSLSLDSTNAANTVWTSPVSASPSYICTNNYNYATMSSIEDMINSLRKPNEFAENFLSLLTPAEIARIWEKIKSRSVNQETKKEVLRQIILTSVMSEKFILDNIELIDKGDLMKNHRQLIESGQYKQVKLYFTI